MNRRIRSIQFLAHTVLLSSAVLWAADGIIMRSPDASGQFCHLKFPAIREDTLFTDSPKLKDPSEGDIIDYYGPCNHDPLGKAEIARQRDEARNFRNRIDGEND